MNSTHKVAGSNPAGDAIPCDHVVGHSWEGEDTGEVFFTVAGYERDFIPERPSTPLYGDQKFSFCPKCGASLADFWKRHES